MRAIDGLHVGDISDERYEGLRVEPMVERGWLAGTKPEAVANRLYRDLRLDRMGKTHTRHWKGNNAYEEATAYSECTIHFILGRAYRGPSDDKKIIAFLVRHQRMPFWYSLDKTRPTATDYDKNGWWLLGRPVTFKWYNLLGIGRPQPRPTPPKSALYRMRPIARGAR